VVHPPFWFFADVARSEDLLDDEPWFLTQCRIASRADQAELVQAISRFRRACWKIGWEKLLLWMGLEQVPK